MKKVAIITGGTRGIGFETAKLFLENDYRVVILGSKKSTVDEAISKLNSKDVLGYFPKLTDENEIKKVFQEIIKKWKRIDVLINNAGVSSKTKIDDYFSSEIDEIINLNIKAPVLCIKSALNELKKNKGVILNTSSMVSFNGQSSGCLYPTSKFAINGLTKSLARELAPFGIRVNAVAPGITETDMFKNLPLNTIENIIKAIPLKRTGSPKDIAQAFLFLASEKASYITGEILQVDGGVIM